MNVRNHPTISKNITTDNGGQLANIIKQIVYIALNAWQIRNDKLHEDKKKNKYTAERDELLNDVKKWYDCEGEFGDNDHYRHFSKSYIDRKNSTNTALQIWTQAVQSTYTYMKKQLKYKNQARITIFAH